MSKEDAIAAFKIILFIVSIVGLAVIISHITVG